MGSIRVVRSDGIPVSSAGESTDAWSRKIIEVDEHVTINEARNQPQAMSDWHHHGEHAGYVYVLQGQLRIEWGQGGSESAELTAGDFYVVAPNTVHREMNPGPDDQVLIAFVVGSGPLVVNVDGPEPEEAGQEGGSIRVIRDRDIPEGPASSGMTRKVRDVDERVSLGEARNRPETSSGWHHHGERVTFACVQQGRTRLEWGPGGRESAELAAGDCYVISPNTIHREANPGSADQVLVGFYVGSGAKIVNVDGPQPE